MYEGTKMGDINDKVGDVDGNSEGYHAYYLAEFPEINTDSVKVILKAGFLGEPSLYEVTPLVQVFRQIKLVTQQNWRA